MDVKELRAKKQELEEYLLSAVINFESQVGVPVVAIKIGRVDTSTLEEKSSLLDSLEVVLIL